MKIFFTSVLIGLAFIVCGQKKIDKVTLKNNETISGKIIERIDSVSVKIETDKSNVTVIPWEQIASISNQEPVNTRWLREHKRNLRLARVLAKGFAGEVCMPGYQNLNGSMMTAYFSLGYQANPYLVMMAGMGVEVFSGTYVPFFVDLRVNFIPRMVTPFVFIRGGYALMFTKTHAVASNNYRTSEYSGGVSYLNTGAGIKFKFLPHFGMNVKAGYRLGENNTHGVNVSLAIEF